MVGDLKPGPTHVLVLRFMSEVGWLNLIFCFKINMFSIVIINKNIFKINTWKKIIMANPILNPILELLALSAKVKALFIYVV